MEPEERNIREEPGPGGPYREHHMHRDDDPDFAGPTAVSSDETDVVSRFSPARGGYETMYVLFAIIVGAIFIRVLVKVLGANTAVAFTQFMSGVTDTLLATFRGLLMTLVCGRR